MTGAENGGAQRREPIVLGVTGALIGVALAVALLVFGNFGGTTTPAGASGSPGTLPSASIAPSQVAIASPGATVEVTIAPPTAPATAIPATAAPTAKPTKTPKPTPTPNTNPAIVSFETPKQEDCTNSTAGSIHITWSVKRATGVSISIDGPGIYDSYAGLTGEVDVPYGCDHTKLSHTYTLTTIGGTGPAASVTKTIKTRAPSITAFAVNPVTDCAGDTGQANLRFSYTVRAATGADLYYRTDPEAPFLIYGNYNGTEVGPIGIPYSCQYESITYRLVTTGGYGDAARQSITVTRP
ncbi:MAG TPA: hypothetical protein VFP56_06110 [Candidatus Limnocylindrales bacterium]|nr:hypothetical protein [Candidatus Limnocylindrales bacterium]